MLAESVAQDLDEARERLGGAAEHTSFRLLIAGAEPSLEQFAQAGRFDLVLLPARHRPLRAWAGPYHPEASQLRLIAGAEVRLVSPASR